MITLQTGLLLLLPILGALLGWITNWLAIRMLFRPRQPVRILGWTWQGLIPLRQKAVARQAAEVIEREILDSHLLRHEIERIELEPHIESIAMTLVYEGAAPRLRAIPLLGNFVSDGVLRSLHRVTLEELRKEARPMMTRIAAEAEKRLDVRRLVEERIAGFDLDHLEAVVRSVAQREFRAIEAMGAVVGFLVGVLQLLALLLAGVVRLW